MKQCIYNIKESSLNCEQNRCTDPRVITGTLKQERWLSPVCCFCHSRQNAGPWGAVRPPPQPSAPWAGGSSPASGLRCLRMCLYLSTYAFTRLPTFTGLISPLLLWQIWGMGHKHPEALSQSTSRAAKGPTKPTRDVPRGRAFLVAACACFANPKDTAPTPPPQPRCSDAARPPAPAHLLHGLAEDVFVLVLRHLPPLVEGLDGQLHLLHCPLLDVQLLHVLGVQTRVWAPASGPPPRCRGRTYLLVLGLLCGRPGRGRPLL